MPNVNEIIGRLTLENTCLNENYDQLLDILRGVIAGDIAKDRVTVDTGARSWAVSPPKDPGVDDDTDIDKDSEDAARHHADRFDNTQDDPDIDKGPRDDRGFQDLPKGAGKNENA